MTLLIDAEMKRFERLNTPVIFIQNVVTDLLLGLKLYSVFAEFARYVQERYRAEPGFITMNLPLLLDALEEVGVKNPIVCANINKIGFRMCGGIEAYVEALRNRRCRPIAMSVFASGAIAPAQAIVPPESPVPAPRGTIATPASRAARTIATTSSAVPGTATADGGCRSNPASYSHTKRSAGRQNTFSAPHISSSRRTSELGAVFTGRATRGGPGEWGWARAGGALGRGRRPGQNTAARVGGGQRPGCRSRPALDPGTGPRVAHR